MAIETSPGGAQDAEGLGFTDGLFEGIGVGVIVIEKGGKTVKLTSSAEQLLGLAPSGAATARIEDLPAPLARFAREVSLSAKPVSCQTIDVSGKRSSPVRVQVTAVPIGSETEGGPVALVLCDITPMRHIEQQVIRLDRLASLGTLAAGMAHEVKNALVACKTFIDLLLEKNQDAELAQIVRREMGRIDVLVTRMLKFGGRNAEHFSAVHAHEIVEHSLRLLERQMEEKSISLIRALEAVPDVVRGDEHALQQAFLNLLLNAVEAMEPKGTLTVGSYRLPQEMDAAQHPSQGQVYLTIQDTGAGISKEVLSHLFEPFVTTKPNGTGLGLAITRRIVQQHQGTIAATSQPGQGTTFKITLPAAQAGE